MEKIDLHIHTNLSDGSISSDEVIKKAYAEGCKLIAITDHDIAYENNSDNNFIIPGIEFNTAYRNMHILGYGISDSKALNNDLLRLRLENELVVLKVIKLLEESGFDINPQKLYEFLEQEDLDTSILDKRKLVKYLIAKGYASDILGAYQTLIGVNQKYYVPNKKLSPKEVITLIKHYKGVSVLAHPNILKLNDADLDILIKELKSEGLEGIEIYNAKMHLPYNESYMRIAYNNDLLVTMGSDFHDPDIDTLGVMSEERLSQKLLKRINHL